MSTASLSRWYPWRQPAAVTTLVLGGFLLYYGGFVVVPMVFVMGYMVRVVRRAADGRDPPTFDEWGRLFREGVGAYAIWLVYLSFPILNAYLVSRGETTGVELLLVLLVVLVGGGLLRLVVPFTAQAGGVVALDLSELVGADPTVFDGFARLDVYLMLLVVLYIVPAALSNYAAGGRIRDGFDFGTLRPVLFDPRYAVWWLGFGVLFAAGNAAVLFAGSVFTDLGGSLASLGLVVLGSQLAEYGVTLAAFVGFALIASAHYLGGRGWAAATCQGETGGAPSGDGHGERADARGRPDAGVGEDAGVDRNAGRGAGRDRDANRDRDASRGRR